MNRRYEIGLFEVSLAVQFRWKQSDPPHPRYSDVRDAPFGEETPQQHRAHQV